MKPQPQPQPQPQPTIREKIIVLFLLPLAKHVLTELINMYL